MIYVHNLHFVGTDLWRISLGQKARLFQLALQKAPPVKSEMIRIDLQTFDLFETRSWVVMHIRYGSIQADYWSHLKHILREETHSLQAGFYCDRSVSRSLIDDGSAVEKLLELGQTKHATKTNGY